MLQVRDLVKHFPLPRRRRGADARAIDPRERDGRFHAVDGVTFSAPTGRVLGLLGPNGAGKTTLLRVLSTALVPSADTATLAGTDIARQPLQVRRRIGFLSGATGLYGRLTPREMIGYFGRLHGLPPARVAERIAELSEMLDMRTFLDRRNDTLSTGMKQKTNIARTLVHDPDVIVFDEPTTGLDVAAAEAILTLVERCRDEGKTVVLSTHHMHEVERVCDAIVLVHEGKVRFSGTALQMRERGGAETLDRAFLALIAPEVSGAA